MADDKIVEFPGMTKLDIPVDKVLQAAMDAGLSDVIVIGREEGGKLYFASCSADVTKVHWDLVKAQEIILEYDR